MGVETVVEEREFRRSDREAEEEIGGISGLEEFAFELKLLIDLPLGCFQLGRWEKKPWREKGKKREGGENVVVVDVDDLRSEVDRRIS